MGKTGDEFELRLREIIYDLQTMSENKNPAKEDVDFIFDKVAEVQLELHDTVIRTIIEGIPNSLTLAQFVSNQIATRVLSGYKDRSRAPELFYAQESDDIMNTI